MLAILINLSVSILTIVVCADNLVVCSPEGLPELPQSAKYYPYLNNDSFTAFLLRQNEETSAYVVYGGGKPKFEIFTHDGFVHPLVELTFYSTVDNLLVEYLPIFKITTVRRYNFIRVHFITLSSLDLSYHRLSLENTFFYFYKNASLVNPERVTLYTDGSVSYPLTETNKIDRIYFDYRSQHNFSVNIDDWKNRIYLFRYEYPLLTGLDYTGKLLVLGRFVISFYFNKNSDYQTPIIFTVSKEEFITFNPNQRFHFIYVPENREIIDEHEITIIIDKEMDYQFHSGINFNFYIESANLNLKIIRKTSNPKIAIKVFDWDSSIIYSDPINQYVVMYNEDSMRPFFCDDNSMLCLKISSQHEFDKYADTFFQIPALFLNIKGSLSLNLSKINLTNEFNIYVASDPMIPDECHFNMIDSPSSPFYFETSMCNVTFPKDKITDVLGEIKIYDESIISNPENVNFLRLECYVTLLYMCQNKKKKTAMVGINIELQYTKLTFHKNRIVFSDMFDNPYNEFTYGENGDVNAEEFIFVLEFMFLSGSCQMIIGRDPSAEKIPNFSFRNAWRREDLIKYVILFDKSIQNPPNPSSDKVIFTVLIEKDQTGFFYINNPPSWFIYTKRMKNNPSDIIDMSPVTKQKFIFCTPETICSGLQLSNDEKKGLVYRPYVRDPDAYSNSEVSARILNSLDYIDYVAIIYGDTINPLRSPYNYDPFDSSHLDKINDTIHFTTEYAAKKVVVDIRTTRSSRAKTWIVEGVTLNSIKYWDIPNIRMLKGGRFFSSVGVNSTNIEVDSMNIDVLSNMKYQNLTINLELINDGTTFIFISEDSIIINLSYTATNIPQNANVTIVVTQVVLSNQDFKILIFPNSQNSNIRNLRFLINENNQNKVILDFGTNAGWETALNSPFFEIISKNYSKAEIKNIVHPIQLLYRGFQDEKYDNQNKYLTYEEFPMNKTNIGICLTNIDDSYCSNFFSKFIDDEESIFKKIETNDELKIVFHNFLHGSKISNVYLLIQASIIQLDFNPPYFIPPNIHIEGDNTTILYIFIGDENTTELISFDSFSLNKCKVNFIPNFSFNISDLNPFVKFKTLSINNGQVNAIIEANTIFSSIFDFPTINGYVENAILNYTSEEVLVSPISENGEQNNSKHLFSNHQNQMNQNQKINDSKKTPKEKKIPNIDIIISKTGIIFDSFEVYCSSFIKIKNAEYEILFNQSSTITFKYLNSINTNTHTKDSNKINDINDVNDLNSIDKGKVIKSQQCIHDISKKVYNFSTKFIEKKDGYIDRRTLQIIFDKSWSIYENSFQNKIQNYEKDDDINDNLTINVTPKQNNAIFYTIQEIPKYINLHVKRGVVLSYPSATPLSSFSTPKNPYQKISVLVTLIGLFFIVSISGIVIIIYFIKRKYIIKHDFPEKNEIDIPLNNNTD